MFLNDDVGISLYSSSGNVVSDNNCANNIEYGIYLSSSNSNILSNNDCSSNWGGIELFRSSSNSLVNNDCSNCGESVKLYSSSYNNIDSNNCSDSDYGLMIEYSSNDNTLDNNTCRSNSYNGIYLISSSNNLMLRNRICNDVHEGVYIFSPSSANNRIWNNTFISNNAAGAVYDPSHAQAYDAGTNNWWNTSGIFYCYGNYWSDWLVPDVVSPWGIVDNPYHIGGGGGGRDCYPLTGAAVFLANWTLHLTSGWNFVTLPTVSTSSGSSSGTQRSGYKASTLGLYPGDTVSTWNSMTRIYKNHIVGIPINDFEILSNVGYWINVPNGTRTLTLHGNFPTIAQQRNISVPAGGGWAIIGFVGLNMTRHASDIPAMYSVPGSITLVATWDPVGRVYKSWLSVIPTVNNFLLVPGQAYWILCGTSGTLSYSP